LGALSVSVNHAPTAPHSGTLGVLS
jgi:hypothetical protein